MVRWLVATGLRGRRVVAACAVGLLVVGVIQLREAKVDSLPEFGPPIVEVDTEALGLSAPEVEQLITVPLEQDLLDGVAWLAQIHSISMPGLSHVTMVFDPGTDLLRARQVVQERISQAAGLPNVSSLPQMIQPESSTSRVMMVGLSSSTVSQIDMSVLARWTIRPRLLGVPGVANVSIWGQRERQLQVLVDPERLAEDRITLQDVIETAGNALWASPLTFLEANTPGTGGFVDTHNQRLGVQHLQPISTAADLARVPVEAPGGRSVPLDDIATVIEDHQPLIGDNVLTGGAGLLLVIEKFPGANTVDVTRGVDEALDALRPGLSGIRIDPTIYRPADYIETSAHNVGVAVVLGLVLAILAIAALLGGWRRTLLTVLALAVSLLSTAIVLHVLGATFNAMVIAGLVLGLSVVIDDAVADVERVRRPPDEPLDGERSLVAAIMAGAREMRTSALYASILIGVAVVPLFFLRGEPGAFLPPLVRAYLLAIAVSMVVALLVTPALTGLLLNRRALDRGPSAIARRLRAAYERVLLRLVAAPRIAAAGLAGLLVIGLVAVPFLRRTALPSIDDADVLVHWVAPPGTSLTEMDRITSRATAELRAIPGVANVAAHVGRAINSDQAVNVDTGEIWVNVDPAADHAAVVASVREVVNGYPGISAQLLTYPNERVTNVLTDPASPITVRVFGQSPAILSEKATEIRDAMASVDGVVSPRIHFAPTEPSIDVRVDLGRAEAFGIKPGDVRRGAATVMSGIAVGSLFEQQKVFDVVVWGTPDVRSSLSAVRGLLIDTPGGGHVRLDRVADVTIEPTPAAIRHEDISRYLDVTAGVSGRDVGDVAADVQRRVDGLTFPMEYHAEVIRNDADAIASSRRLLAVAVAAAIGVFLVLQAAFRSWRLALLAFVIVTVALSGGAVGALVTGRLVSIGSVAGFFGVLAIGARWAILQIRHYQYLEADEGSPFGDDLIVRGSSERLVPTVSSAAAIALALIPLAVSTDVAGQEVLHPMAAVVIGGLVTSLVAATLITPALCARLRTTPQPDLFEIALRSEERVVTIPDLAPVGATAAGTATSGGGTTTVVAPTIDRDPPTNGGSASGRQSDGTA
jgi:Cu/Ag efflux pump CusA